MGQVRIVGVMEYGIFSGAINDGTLLGRGGRGRRGRTGRFRLVLGAQYLRPRRTDRPGGGGTAVGASNSEPRWCRRSRAIPRDRPAEPHGGRRLGNRFTLGIGLSHKIVIENMFGLSYDRPVRHLREYLVC